MFGTLLLLVAAAYCTYRTSHFLQTARRVSGELVGYRSYRDDENDLVHIPIFRFVDASGQLITTANPRNITVIRRLNPGQQCELRYNPANPAEVYRDTWSDLWLVPTVLWIVSILGLIHVFI